MPLVNDIHSGLNPTQVAAIIRPSTCDEIVRVVRETAGPISIAGGRHAMGGQQFGTNTTLLDLDGLDRIIALDHQLGIVEVEAGIQWPALIAWLVDSGSGWGVRQKQTGADRLSIGGALSANIHGRGLALKPMVQDVESFDLIDAAGELRHCSRSVNNELFQLAIGGYGLFGVIVRIRLRLARRQRLERLVEITSVDRLLEDFARRIADGCLYGDFQFMTDEASPLFMREGVLSCYRPLPGGGGDGPPARELAADDWRRLYHLAHTDRAELYRVYAGFYASTHGQRYWSDTHQLSIYLDGYHQELDRQLGATLPGSEMISELYVPRAALADFCLAAREELRRRRTPVIYGTIRLIERDDESVLAWAREPWACIIFNLCVRHDADGISAAAEAFRALIDCAAACGGSYFPTYHRWASREQVEKCHPALVRFLRAKRRLDPAERFQSDWYRHYRTMFAGFLS
jgi:FAD/FMN-containing dehydrogenase